MDLSWLSTTSSILIIPALLIGIFFLVLLGRLWKALVFYWLTNGVAIINGVKNYLLTGDTNHLIYAFNPFFYYDLSIADMEAPTVISFILLFIVLFYIVKSLFKSWDVSLFVTFLTGYVAGQTFPNIRELLGLTQTYNIFGVTISDAYLFPLFISILIFLPRLTYIAWKPEK